MLHNRNILLWGLACAIVASPSMRADFITTSQPASAYVSNTTLLDFADPDFTTISSLSGGGETLTYSTPIDQRTVPDSWNTWNTPPTVETTSPRVGTTDGVPNLTITLSAAASIFGLEIEPDNFGTESITAAYYSGSILVGTIGLNPDGNGGALLYAASTGTSPFTKIVLTNTTGDDFAIGRQRFTIAAASVPEPTTFAMAGSALLLALALKRRASRES